MTPAGAPCGGRGGYPLSRVGQSSVVGVRARRSRRSESRRDGTRRPGGAAGDPGVEGALLLVVRAAARALRRAGLEVGEVLDDPGRVDVGQPERPDAGGVDDPAVVVGQGEGDRRRRGVPAPAGDVVDDAGGPQRQRAPGR